MSKFMRYLEGVLMSFVLDPADSEYQRGYEACARETLEYFQQEKNIA